jgi:hypothetical protein
MLYSTCTVVVVVSPQYSSILGPIVLEPGTSAAPDPVLLGYDGQSLIAWFGFPRRARRVRCVPDLGDNTGVQRKPLPSCIKSYLLPSMCFKRCPFEILRAQMLVISWHSFAVPRLPRCPGHSLFCITACTRTRNWASQGHL